MDYTNYENIIIITSLLNCPSYRSVYNRSERFEQTKNTLNTIKAKIPNIFIILIDVSIFTEEESNYFVSNCNIIINDYNNEKLVNAVNHPNKSYGEKEYLLRCIEEINKNKYKFINLKSIFKISGRYYLNDNFNYMEYNNDKNVIHFLDINLWEDACPTCLFKISFNNLEEFKNFLINAEYSFNLGLPMEKFLYFYIKNIDNSKYIHLNVLGISGLVATNGGFGSN